MSHEKSATYVLLSILAPCLSKSRNYVAIEIAERILSWNNSSICAIVAHPKTFLLLEVTGTIFYTVVTQMARKIAQCNTGYAAQ